MCLNKINECKNSAGIFKRLLSRMAAAAVLLVAPHPLGQHPVNFKLFRIKSNKKPELTQWLGNKCEFGRDLLPPCSGSIPAIVPCRDLLDGE